SLTLAGLVGQKMPVVLICATQTEAESAYGLTTQAIADVVVTDQLKRLPFILRREFGRASLASQSDATRTTNTTTFAMGFAEREIARKQAEIVLPESEGRYHRMLDDLLEGAEIIGFDWRYLYVNDASASHGRMSKEALLRGTVLELYPGIEQSELFAHLRICMEERIPQHFESEFSFPDGAKTWFELSVQPIEEGIFILSLDITERKRSEMTLQRYVKRMEVLHEIDTGIINATSTEEIVETALKYIRELIPCRRATVVIFDLPTNEGILFADHTDQPHSLNKSFRAPLPPNWDDGFGSNTSRIIDDLRLAKPQTTIYQTLIKDGFLSGIQALLMVQGQRIGLLGLNADTPNFFTAEHLEIASEIANQLAIALRQMQLSDVLTHHAFEMEQKNVDLTLAETQLQRYARRMEILHEIDNGLIQGTSIPALIQVTLKNLRQLIPCQQANVTMIDAKTGEGQIFAHDLNRDSFFVEGIRFALPDDVYDGYDARHLRIFNDIRPLQETSPRAKQLVSEGLMSLLSAMLTDHDKPMGSLVLVSDTLNFFTAEYQEIAAQVANQLAIAIRQLQLSNKLHDSETRYRRVVEDQTDLICRYKAD
ncbi:MAG: GAF domain-containing protein, partial [Chloroflexota bacterium]